MTAPDPGFSGIAISPAILGCGTFGGIGGVKELIGKGLSRDAAFAAMDEAADLGITVFDTAERYSGGDSERWVGEWLATRPANVVSATRLATKVAPPQIDGVEGRSYDQSWIEERLAISLERLGVDRVSFYLSHAPDRHTPIEATLEGFAAVIEAGRVLHIGCCNVGADELIAASDTAERLNVRGFEWVQNSFSLLTASENREVRAVCRERGLGYTPYSPLAGGVLTGKYRRGQAHPEGSRLALRPEGQEELLTERVYDAIDTLCEAAAARGISAAALALAWIIEHPDCTAPVVGPSRSPPHLGHVAEALGVTLGDADHAKLETAFTPT